nr:response regulator transcription factor [uncultured Merdimonas sp.]
MKDKMPGRRILLVEDDWELGEGMVWMLEKEGFLTFWARSLKEAGKLYQAEGAELILLDVNLPDGEGFDLCQQLKDTPVLFLTARDLEEDVLKGYELGAQDYVTKPFSMKVLLKKINVILKRERENGWQIFDDGYLHLDLPGAKVEVKGRSCPVTPTEFRLLKEFLSHKGQLLTYDVLLDSLWEGGSQLMDRHALTVNVGRLRGKIEDEEHKYISNVYGMGYQWIG